MIKLYGMSSPNVLKVILLLAETDLPFTFHHVNIWDGEQFSPEFVALNPNSKVPVIIDPEGPDGCELTLSESGAILYYLACKTERFLPAEPAMRFQVMQWLMFQMASVGPMFGQANHFRNAAPPDNEYALQRYNTEVRRLFDVLEHRLDQAEYVGGDDYSIVDIAVFPWAGYYEVNGVDIDRLPGVKRWMDAVSSRPGTKKADELWTEVQEIGQARRAAASDDGRDRLYGRGRYNRAQMSSMPTHRKDT